ncbi:hypothetical protein AAFF_G00177750 [Aldrovandia affinis]|uniref:Interleukin-1 n=1 Tax=Aldrovandia affinis TaxID=143900 RepID=A0AAD7RKL8_9TELE|nr:hypothetical protein AAFF_G00177750 [Aldrovandia affinis]
MLLHTTASRRAPFYRQIAFAGTTSLHDYKPKLRISTYRRKYHFTEKDNMEFKTSCNNLEKVPSCDCQEGLQLEVTQHPHAFCHVANLIIALQRMKHCHTPLGTEFSDDDLLNYMLENVVEEHVALRVLEGQENMPTVFRRTRVLGCSVCDKDQKSLVLNQGPLRLHAVILQGGNMDLKVQLNMSTYIARNFTDSTSRPVALGIAGTNFYLFCSLSDDQPILQLEEVNNKDTLKRINEQGDMARFLFLKRDSGLSVTRLESLKFRGWFISTAVDDKKPVEMCTEDSMTHITSFTIKQL